MLWRELEESSLGYNLCATRLYRVRQGQILDVDTVIDDPSDSSERSLAEITSLVSMRKFEFTTPWTTFRISPIRRATFLTGS
jgi:hypothetical protein